MRDAYHEDLDAITDTLVEMAGLVGSMMGRATTALLDADLSLAEGVISADETVDALYAQVERVAMDLLARQQPVASDLRVLITSLRMVAAMAASLLAGQVTSRTGRYKVFPVVGSVLLVAGMLLLSRVGADTALWQTDLCMVVFGAGLGMNMQSIVLAMQNAVDPRDMGVATSAVTICMLTPNRCPSMPRGSRMPAAASSA